MTQNVLVLFDTPDDFSAYLAERFPSLNFTYVTKPEDLEPMLKAVNPDIAYSIKHHGMPKYAHPPLATYPSIKWFQIGGSGYDHIPAWDTDRLTVTNCAGVLARFLAETVTGAMIAMNGGFFQYKRQQQAKIWQINPFKPLVGQTLLVVGLGRIGTWVARNAKALGMHVIGIRGSQTPCPDVDEQYQPHQLADVVGRADYVSLHLRLSPQTTHLFDAKMLATMKPGAKLLNTARGEIVDEAAMIKALQSGQLGGAYLDVFNKEPLPDNNPLWELENVLLTPHGSDSVVRWQNRFTEFFAENLDRYLAGKPLKNVVIPNS